MRPPDESLAARSDQATPLTSWLLAVYLFSGPIFFGTLGALGGTHRAGDIGLQVFNGALLAGLIGCILLARNSGLLGVRMNRRRWVLLGLVVTIGVSAGLTWVMNPGAVVMGNVLYVYFTLCLPAALIACFVPAHAALALRRPMVVVSVYLTVVLSAFVVRSPSIGEANLNDVGGTTHLTVGLAMAMALGVNISELFRGRRRLLVPVFLVLAGLNLCVIVVSGSRGALVGATVMVLVLAYHRRWQLQRVAGFVTAILMIVAVIYLWTTLQVEGAGGTQRIAALFADGQDQSKAARIDLYGYTWQRVVDAAAWGRGVGSYSVDWGSYAYPHNFFLEVANDFGIIGIVIAAAVCIGTFVRAGRVLRSRTFESIGIVAVLSIGALAQLQFSGSYTATTQLWVLLGLLWIHGRPMLDAVIEAGADRQKAMAA